MAKVARLQHLPLILPNLRYAQRDKARVSTTVLTRDHQQRIDLVYPSTEDSDGSPDEVVLSLQGFLIQSGLPPITNSHAWVYCTT